MIMGVPSYRILDNPEMQLAVQYFPPEAMEGCSKSEREMVDLAYVCLNWPFLPKHEKNLF